MINQQEIRSPVHRTEERSNLKIQSHTPGVLSSCIAQNWGSAGTSEMEGGAGKRYRPRPQAASSLLGMN